MEQGTCGWTDSSILRGHHFYPPHVHTAVDRLRHYSATFPCVEVDSSNYAIPPPSRVASWVAVTPPSFLFHFKVYGLFTALHIRSDAIPGPLRDHLHTSPTPNPSPSTIHLSTLPPSFTTLLWAYFNASLAPAHATHHLGLTIFQFHLSFHPTAPNRRHVEWCRTHLHAPYRMAVEFRDRAWTQGEELQATRRWLTSMDVTLVCEDDLAQEVHRPGRVKMGEDHRLPIVLTPTSSHSLYVRLHRRVGDNRGDRVLRASEVAEWGQRLREVRGEVGGAGRAMFFMWGTDCWDDPVVNAKALERELRGGEVWLDWAGMQRERKRGEGGGNLLALFQKQVEQNDRKEQEEEDALSVGKGEDARDEVEGRGGGEAAEAEEVAESSAPAKAMGSSELKRARDDGAGSAAKKQRIALSSPSRAVKGKKQTAKDRQTAVGKISSFFTKQQPP